jgi:Protein of unknown function (DUF2490)
MKKVLKFILTVSISFARARCLYGQDLNFPGIAASVSFSAILNNKFDFNISAASKFRLGQYYIDATKYNPRVLEIYSQVLLSYKINNHWQISGGYGFQRNNPFLDSWRNEHRFVLQLLFIVPFKVFKFYNRFRFEERWFSFPAAHNESGTRARYQAGIIRQLKGNMVYWQLNDEVYGITSGNRNAFISENWIYTGIGFPVKYIGHLETGIGINSVVRNRNKDLTNLFLVQLAWSYITPGQMMKTIHPVMHSRNF